MLIAAAKVGLSSSNILCLAASSLVPNNILSRISLFVDVPNSQLLAIIFNSVNHLSKGSVYFVILIILSISISFVFYL